MLLTKNQNIFYLFVVKNHSNQRKALLSEAEKTANEVFFIQWDIIRVTIADIGFMWFLMMKIAIHVGFLILSVILQLKAFLKF